MTPENQKYMNVLSAISNCFMQAGGTFQQALPHAPNPFMAGVEYVTTMINTIRDDEARTEYNFGGIQCLHLMDRYRRDKMLNSARPDIFEAPPEIVWPPSLYERGDYINRDFITAHLRANVDSIPDVFTVELPAYRFQISRFYSVSDWSILDVYGEHIEVHNNTGYIPITKDQFLTRLKEVVGESYVEPETDAKAITALANEALAAYNAALRKIVNEVRAWCKDNPPHQDTERLIRDIVDAFNESDRSWYRTKQQLEYRVDWRIIYYRLAAIDPALADLWRPLVVEAAPVEEKEENNGTNSTD